jgi:cysteine desulfurase / selenocysteine lyase
MAACKEKSSVLSGRGRQSRRYDPLLSIRDNFPIFKSRSASKPLAYLDSAASAQKPKCVVDRLANYLSSEHANVHRGAYTLSAESTKSYDLAREKVASFIGASSPSSLIFTRGTTESINLVAHSLERWFRPGDVILLTLLEHHSNIVPWQLLSDRRGVKLVFADIHDDASLNLEDFQRKVALHNPKLVAMTQLSNAFGTVTPVSAMIQSAKSVGAKVLVDGAQGVTHQRVRMEELGADFYAFSAHKLYGPTGIGALYVAPGNYEVMEPFNGGGDMITTVTTEGSQWADPPRKFEAGTPSIAEAIAFGTAVDFLQVLGMDRVAAHEAKIFDEAYALLTQEAGVTVYGPRTTGGAQSSILPFTVEGVHAHDLATIADSMNVCIRGGHHCAMPALKRLGLPATARASIGVYTRISDFELLISAIRKAREIFGE